MRTTAEECNGEHRLDCEVQWCVLVFVLLYCGIDDWQGPGSISGVLDDEWGSGLCGRLRRFCFGLSGGGSGDQVRCEVCGGRRKVVADGISTHLVGEVGEGGGGGWVRERVYGRGGGTCANSFAWSSAVFLSSCSVRHATVAQPAASATAACAAVEASLWLSA